MAKYDPRQNLIPGGLTDAAREKSRQVRESERRADEYLRKLTEQDPDAVLLAMFQAGVAATRALRKWNRRGGEPSRNEIDAVKEARQLALTCQDILKARGASTEAESFFAGLASRLSEANLGKSPRPVGEVAGA
jgi:hypothetical protein